MSNGNKTRETHAAVIAEMHDFADKCNYGYHSVVCEDMHDYITRLEASHKREVSKLRWALNVIRGLVKEELEDLKDINNDIRDDFISIQGWCDHALKPQKEEGNELQRDTGCGMPGGVHDVRKGRSPMNKLYYYEIPEHPESSFASGYRTIEECVEACKAKCLELGVDYDDPGVKLYLTNDFGDTFEECTEEGELAG